MNRVSTARFESGLNQRVEPFVAVVRIGFWPNGDRATR